MRALAIITAVGCGLWGGVFFAFSVFVMRGLGKLPAAEGIASMNSINASVFNPWFMVPFLGTPLLCVALAIFAIVRSNEPGSGWLLAGSLIFIAGCLLVTMFFNVPLNNALIAAHGTDGVGQWSNYQSAWTAWNHVRALTSITSCALIILGLR